MLLVIFDITCSHSCLNLCIFLSRAQTWVEATCVFSKVCASTLAPLILAASSPCLPPFQRWCLIRQLSNICCFQALFGCSPWSLIRAMISWQKKKSQWHIRKKQVEVVWSCGEERKRGLSEEIMYVEVEGARPKQKRGQERPGWKWLKGIWRLWT